MIILYVIIIIIIIIDLDGHQPRCCIRSLIWIEVICGYSYKQVIDGQLKSIVLNHRYTEK